MGSPVPTQAGFLTFLYTVAGIPEANLPSDSEWIGWAYGTAINQVNPQIMQVPGPFYLQAVYYLGTDFIINNAPDVADAPPYPGPPPNPDGLPYFAFLRAQWNLLGFIAGVINASSDVSTSQSMTVPEAFEHATMSDLQLMKTPWGQRYLAIAQKVGSVWGLT